MYFEWQSLAIPRLGWRTFQSIFRSTAFNQPFTMSTSSYLRLLVTPIKRSGIIRANYPQNQTFLRSLRLVESRDEPGLLTQACNALMFSQSLSIISLREPRDPKRFGRAEKWGLGKGSLFPNDHASPLDSRARVHSPHQDKLKETAWPVNLKKKRHCSQSIDIRATRPGSKGKKKERKYAQT